MKIYRDFSYIKNLIFLSLGLFCIWGFASTKGPFVHPEFFGSQATNGNNGSCTQGSYVCDGGGITSYFDPNTYDEQWEPYRFTPSGDLLAIDLDRTQHISYSFKGDLLVLQVPQFLYERIISKDYLTVQKEVSGRTFTYNYRITLTRKEVITGLTPSALYRLMVISHLPQ